MSLTLAKSNEIASAALQAAVDLGVHIGVVVVDPSGHILCAQRHEHAYLSVLMLAEHKAFTAINFRRGTHEMAEKIGSFELANHLSLADRRLVFLAGGMPVYRSDALIGGVGVSGATADQDRQLCIRALEICGLDTSRAG